MILYNKIKGANFETTSDLLETYWSIINEPIKEDHYLTIGKESKIDLKDWISRTLNIITALYAKAHNQVTNEIGYMAFLFSIELKENM